MEYRVWEDFSDKKGVISNTHGFLSLYLDGSFQEKWNGYWSPSYKYLDYFAAKVNGVWLNRETLEEACYGETLTLHHETPSLSIKQEISCPDEIPGFKIEWNIENRSEAQKAVKLSFETGIDMRPKTKDIGDRDYTLESGEDGIRIGKNGKDKYLEITGEKFKFSGSGHTKEHFPGERQVCIVPEDIHSRTELDAGETQEISLTFMTDGEPGIEISESESTLRHPELGITFDYTIRSMENLIYDKNGLGVIAGHPWFQNYWARDTFQTVLGMIEAGMFEESERILMNFAEKENFPSKIKTDGSTETDYPRADSIPLFALAVEKLDRHFDAEEELLMRANELLEEKKPEGELVDHDKKGTWMDTLERENAVEIQAEWISALEKYGKDSEKLVKGLERFEDKKFLKDNLENDFESINPALALILLDFKEEKAEKYLEKINGEFSSRYGARTRSLTDPGYKSDGYHTGSVWGLTTCWAAGANLKYENQSHGLNFLKKFTKFIDRGQPGALPEVVNAESGESMGCEEQAWSAGSFVYIVDRYLLGIDVRKDKVIIDPADGLSCERRQKRIRDEYLDIEVNNGEAEVLNNPDLNIEVK